MKGDLSSFLGSIDVATNATVLSAEEDVLTDSMAEFLAQGLLEGQGAVFTGFRTSPHIFRERISTYGIDVEKFEREGALMVSTFDSQSTGSEGIRPRSMWVHQLAEHFRNIGMRSWRETGETGWWLKEDRLSQFLEREKDHEASTQYAGLCGFNLADILSLNSLEVIVKIVRSHERQAILGRGTQYFDKAVMISINTALELAIHIVFGEIGGGAIRNKISDNDLLTKLAFLQKLLDSGSKVLEWQACKNLRSHLSFPLAA